MLNHRGEPQWDGSDAQMFLKEDITAGKHLLYKTPSEFCATRDEYKALPKKVFRGHIHQEKRLRKLFNLINNKRNEKAQKQKQQQAKQQAQQEARELEAKAKAALAAARQRRVGGN